MQVHHLGLLQPKPSIHLPTLISALRSAHIRAVEWGVLFTDADSVAVLYEVGPMLAKLGGAIESATRLKRFIETSGKCPADILEANPPIDIGPYLQADAPKDPKQLPLFSRWQNSARKPQGAA